MFQSPIGTQKTTCAKDTPASVVAFQSPIGTQKTHFHSKHIKKDLHVSIPYRYTKNKQELVLIANIFTGFNPL